MTTKQIIINTFLCTLGKTGHLQTKNTKTKPKQNKNSHWRLVFTDIIIEDIVSLVVM